MHTCNHSGNETELHMKFMIMVLFGALYAGAKTNLLHRSDRDALTFTLKCFLGHSCNH